MDAAPALKRPRDETHEFVPSTSSSSSSSPPSAAVANPGDVQAEQVAEAEGQPEAGSGEQPKKYKKGQVRQNVVLRAWGEGWNRGTGAGRGGPSEGG